MKLVAQILAVVVFLLFFWLCLLTGLDRNIESQTIQNQKWNQGD